MQIMHSRLDHRRPAARNKQAQSLHYRSCNFALTTILKPEQRKGERSIDRCLQLRIIHSKDTDGRPSMTQHSSRVHRAEAVLQICRRDQPFDIPIWEGALQCSSQQPLILQTRLALHGWRPSLAVRDNFDP